MGTCSHSLKHGISFRFIVRDVICSPVPSNCTRHHFSAYLLLVMSSVPQRLSLQTAYVSIRSIFLIVRDVVWSLVSAATDAHTEPSNCTHQHKSAYVSIRQDTEAETEPSNCIRQHTSAHVSTRKQRLRLSLQTAMPRTSRACSSQHTSAYVSIHQHTSAYVSIRQHMSAYVEGLLESAYVSHVGRGLGRVAAVQLRQHTPAYGSRD